MTVSSCFTVAGYLSVRKCIKKKKTPTNKTEPIKNKKTPSENNLKGFNELASDEDGTAIKLNVSSTGANDPKSQLNGAKFNSLNQSISGLNPDALTVAEHHKHMSNE